MRIVGRFFVAVVGLTFAAGALFALTIASELPILGLWIPAAFGALFWIFKKEDAVADPEEPARRFGLTRREIIGLAIAGALMLILAAVVHVFGG